MTRHLTIFELAREIETRLDVTASVLPRQLIRVQLFGSTTNQAAAERVITGAGFAITETLRRGDAVFFRLTQDSTR